MKFSLCFGLWFLILMPQVSFSQTIHFPSPTGYIVDESNIIDDAARARMEAWIVALKQKTSAEIGVVTVASTQPLTIEEYAVKLFQRFGIGQKGKDNGILLLVAFRDRRVRIEVGYGLEGAVTDAQSSRIINEIIVPKFKQGIFSEGIEKGLGAIVTLVAKEYNISLTGVPAPTYQEASGGSFWVFLLVFCLILSFRFSGPMFMLGGSGYSRGRFSTGGFSGGFGGFGGGMSGGGGASGGW